MQISSPAFHRGLIPGRGRTIWIIDQLIFQQVLSSQGEKKNTRNSTLTLLKTSEPLVLLGQSRFSDQKHLVSFSSWTDGKHRTWCLDFRETDGTIQFVDKPNPHTNEKSTQRCQFSCRALDQPDYWLQQIKVIPEYQRSTYMEWPCRTPKQSEMMRALYIL